MVSHAKKGIFSVLMTSGNPGLSLFMNVKQGRQEWVCMRYRSVQEVATQLL